MQSLVNIYFKKTTTTYYISAVLTRKEILHFVFWPLGGTVSFTLGVYLSCKNSLLQWVRLNEYFYNTVESVKLHRPQLLFFVLFACLLK